ncbi:MAG TPA: hypothetical protein VFF30_14400 [Nitrososphaerales archaeon]|nr:hypothetical protein [Nitrososphaerales archaeon]
MAPVRGTFNGIYPSQFMNMTVVAIDEGDVANRTLTVYFNNSAWASHTFTGSSVDSIQQFTFPMGLLESAATYSIGISMNTQTAPPGSYGSPQGWWLVSASIYGIPTPNKVVNARLVYCIPPLQDQTINITRGPTEVNMGGGIGGIQVTAKYLGCSAIKPLFLSTIQNSLGQTVDIMGAGYGNAVAPQNSVTFSWGNNLTPSGTYTAYTWVETDSGIPVSVTYTCSYTMPPP